MACVCCVRIARLLVSGAIPYGVKQAGNSYRGEVKVSRMNMIEKILARASGRKAVEPGEVVVANVDCLLLHDLSGYLTGRVFDKEVRRPMRYPERVVIFDQSVLSRALANRN